jgi:uncharacterized protein (TIGR02996 family)
MWHEYQFYDQGAIKGRIRGVALPDRTHQVVVWTTEGLFTLWYYKKISVTKVLSAHDAEWKFDLETGSLAFGKHSYQMHGDWGPSGEVFIHPTRTEHPAGDRLVGDPDSHSLLVLGPGGDVLQTIPNHHIGTEPWAVAGFSSDGKVMAVADPLSVRLFKYLPEKGVEKPRWASAGDRTDHRGMLMAVIENPDEDVHRLVYADWLEEHGDAARAEFIRLQCSVASRGRDQTIPRADPEHGRIQQLTQQLGARWLAELPVIRGIQWSGFHRGFPGVVVASPTTLARSGRKAWALAPVEMVTITRLNAIGASAIAASRFLERIRVLTVERYSAARDGIGPLRTLLRTPRVANLRRLSFATSRLGDSGLREVFDSPYLTGLEWLNLGYDYDIFGDEYANMLLNSPTFANLRGGFFRGRYSDEVHAKLAARFPIFS